MKSIVVLVDFTEGCKKSLQQAKIIALKSGATVSVTHVVKDSRTSQDAQARLMEFSMTELGPEITPNAIIGEGDLIQAVANTVAGALPDLVVLCTHGIHGIPQRLFGAHVLKLVQALPYTCLVVQENSHIEAGGIKRILFPASPFPDFSQKMIQAARLAKVFDSEIVMYEIEKYLGNAQDDVEVNMKMAEEYFTNEKIKHIRVVEETKIMSLGYARQTMGYAHEHKLDAVCIMSGIQANDVAMLKADKESMLTNDPGIPVLSCFG